MSEDPKELAERSTGLMHVANTLFPEVNLAPWMTMAEKRVLLGLALMDTVADLGEELERRIWLDEQKPKEKSDGEILEMEKAVNGSWKLDFDEKKEKPRGEDSTPPTSNPPVSPETNGAPKEPEFDVADRRGGVALISFFNRQFVTNLRNGLPSEKGLGRRQALHLGAAQKTGVATEPKARSNWEKITGRGKDRMKVAGVE